jgi:hypothetical protein
MVMFKQNFTSSDDSNCKSRFIRIGLITYQRVKNGSIYGRKFRAVLCRTYLDETKTNNENEEIFHRNSWFK